MAAAPIAVCPSYSACLCHRPWKPWVSWTSCWAWALLVAEEKCLSASAIPDSNGIRRPMNLHSMVDLGTNRHMSFAVIAALAKVSVLSPAGFEG